MAAVGNHAGGACLGRAARKRGVDGIAWRTRAGLARPWLNGSLFDDKVPIGYWPLPAAEGLYSFDPASQRQYWADAATHFDQNDWLARAPVFIEKANPYRATALEAVKLSGGIVIAQDEATSESFGMPSSAIATGCVDRVLPLPEIGPALVALARAEATV